MITTIFFLIILTPNLQRNKLDLI